ncbi:hypothetical protein ACU61A_26760 [Pseudonocardia sichuanensis]|uniref:Uncharacterized protein n=1 Tax=Pseudonocardia kunmingensis TaxID=630975 RepID=A0A543E3U9_9PSEU|nr:hypothetical protein [Pseudonocardia kunmingensis]TQM16267.1 hypothetical protein FB558_3075 [Pseudonocardia kunmingensis]
MSTYTAHVTRSGRYWHIHIPEIDRVTQARNVGEIDVMARDLIAVMLDIEPDSFTVDVQVTMPASVREHLDRAEQLRAEELRLRSEAAAEVRAAALELKESGIPLRDLGKLLGVSHQRAHQLVSS